MELNSIQQLAIQLALDNKSFFSILGSAGTGKSTVIAEIFKAGRELGKDYVVLAPTGRAAKLLAQKIGCNVYTIHRFLEYTTRDGGSTYFPQWNRNHQFNKPMHIIIDEASMINREVWDNLLGALPDGSTICLVGDNNQLPPIEKAEQVSAFNLCINNYPHIDLLIRYRFGKQAELSALSDKILEGKLNEVLASKMCYRLDGITDEHMLNKLCSNEKYWAADSQIICPVYKGRTGCDWINKLCQLHRAEKYQVPELEQGFYFGDKVIGTMNNQFFMNGDIGFIEKIGDKTLTVRWAHTNTEHEFPRYIKIFNRDYDLLLAIKPAYAITTHKSQGGEYENVVYVVGKTSIPVLDRANIYTGVTRSKQNLVVLYDRWTLQKGLANVVTKSVQPEVRSSTFQF